MVAYVSRPKLGPGYCDLWGISSSLSMEDDKLAEVLQCGGDLSKHVNVLNRSLDGSWACPIRSTTLSSERARPIVLGNRQPIQLIS